MGQIIIDIPVNKTIYYEIENTSEYQKLLKLLDKLHLIESPSEEDLEDIQIARKTLSDGEFINWEEAKAQLDG